MQEEQPSTEELLAEIQQLRQELVALQQEKNDLEITLEITIAHADLIENQLETSNYQLKAEIVERKSTEAQLQSSQSQLNSLITKLNQEKADLEIILETTIEHSNNLEELLHYQSLHDSLTGLFNRRYMESVLIQKIKDSQQHQKSLCLVMIDIDYFKNFNDKFGHKVGDIVLKLICQFLQRNIRHSDIACRYGGEELILILPQTHLEEAGQLAERLRQGVKSLKQEYSYRFLEGLTISLGVACFPTHGNSVETLLHAADMALYQAKAQGRDRVVISKIQERVDC